MNTSLPGLNPSLTPLRSIGLDVHRDRIYVTELSILEGTYKQYEISTQDKEFEAFVATIRSDDQVALEATPGEALQAPAQALQNARQTLTHPG